MRFTQKWETNLWSRIEIYQKLGSPKSSCWWKTAHLNETFSFWQKLHERMGFHVMNNFKGSSFCKILEEERKRTKAFVLIVQKIWIYMQPGTAAELCGHWHSWIPLWSYNAEHTRALLHLSLEAFPSNAFSFLIIDTRLPEFKPAWTRPDLRQGSPKTWSDSDVINYRRYALIL